MIDLFRNRPAIDAEPRRRVQAWVRDRLNLPPDASITIAELRCDEPGCPPVETVVGVLLPGSSQRKFKIHKPFTDVSLADLEAAIVLDGCEDLSDE